VILKVSYGADPVPFSNWYRHPRDIVLGGSSLDFTTLGVDKNGYYLVVQLRQGAPVEHKIQAFKKPGVFSTNYPLPNLVSVPASNLVTWAIQPAYNFNRLLPSDGYAWFVAKGRTNQGAEE
jgi:hypothetical protein